MFFISSKDNLHDERAAVEEAILDLDLTPVRVETSTWLATPMPDEYLQQVRRSQMVVLLLAPTNTLAAGYDYYKYVEAEVDLAFSDGKTVLLFVRFGLTSQAQDHFLASVQHKVFSRQFNDTSELYRLVRLSVLNELVRRYSTEPLLFKNRRDFYSFSAKFVRAANVRLVVSQLTPILLLGPRARLPYETLLYDALVEVATRAMKTGSPTVTIIYNESSTAAELKQNSDQYDISRFSEYCEIMRGLVGDRVSVVVGPAETIPFVVVDNQYAVGQSVGRRMIVITDAGAEICNELCDMAQVYAADPPDAGIDCFERLLAG